MSPTTAATPEAAAAAAAFAAAFRGPICVTGLYLLLWYYLLLVLQRGTKYRLQAEYAARGGGSGSSGSGAKEKEKAAPFDRYRGGDPRMLWADRVVANTHEQQGPFLAALWLHALTVSADSAAYLGVAYVALRALYPRLLGPTLERINPKRVFAVTGPCYCIIFYFVGSSVYAALSA